ncbi:MAG: hypothetical protein Q8O03_07570 [Nanoarchaeota archaeon]|nr:hypothetical protein [Nanoarchaeota archaeon]
MNKKSFYYTFLFIVLFIFSVNFVSATSPMFWGDCSNAIGGQEGGFECFITNLHEDMLLDEDEDGNISLEFRITNVYNYSLNNATLNIEKCSSEVRFDNIKSYGTVYVKIGDVCVYEYYDRFEGNFFWSNSSFTYFDENNTLKLRKGEFMVPVITKTEFEMRKGEFETVRTESGGNGGDFLFKKIMDSMLIRSFIIVASSFIILLLIGFFIIRLLKSKKFKRFKK